MDAQKLTYFLAAAQTQNFRRAAELCSVAQPVLSRQIAALEGELGVALFERLGRRVALTDAGTAFIAPAQAVLAQMQAGREALDPYRAPAAGELRVGCIEPLATSLLPAACAAFARRHPEASVSITVSGTGDLLEAVNSSQLELGLFGFVAGHQEPQPLLEAREIAHDRLVLWLSAEHPLAGSPAISLGQLLGAPLALLHPRFSLRRYLDQLFKQHDRQPHPAVEIDNVAALKQIVLQGEVVTVLPLSLLSRADRRAGLVTLPLSDLSVTFTFALAYRRDQQLSALARAFIQAVTEAGSPAEHGQPGVSG